MNFCSMLAPSRDNNSVFNTFAASMSAAYGKRAKGFVEGPAIFLRMGSGTSADQIM